MWGKLIGLVAPKLQLGLAVLAGLAALGCVILWFRSEAATARADLAETNQKAAEKVAADNALALAVLRGQQEGGELVASAVAKALDLQRRAATAEQARIFNAPLNQQNNDVVPGVVADGYDSLWQRRAAAAGLPSVGATGGAGNAGDRLPGAAPDATSQRTPAQRRAPHRRRAAAAGRCRRPVPDRGRGLEGMGRLHAGPDEGPQGGLSGARRHSAAAAGARSGAASADDLT